VPHFIVVVDREDEGGYRAGQPADEGKDKHEDHRAAASGAYSAGERRQQEAKENVNTTHGGLGPFL